MNQCTDVRCICMAFVASASIVMLLNVQLPGIQFAAAVIVLNIILWSR